jgi:hypothetical protein
LNLYEFIESNGDIGLTTKADQTYNMAVTTKQNNKITFSSSLSNAGQHLDTVDFNTGINSKNSSSQQYNYFDSTSAGYACSIAAVANALTFFSSGCSQ